MLASYDVITLDGENRNGQNVSCRITPVDPESSFAERTHSTVENLDNHKAGHYATGPLQMSPLARANTLETATVE